MSKQLNELQDFRRPDDWQSELDRLRASNAALLAALRDSFGALVLFGQHASGCKVTQTYKPKDCACRFNEEMNKAEAAIAAAEETKP